MKKKISLISLSLFMFLFGISSISAKGFSSTSKTACGFEYMPSKLPHFISSLYDIVKLLVPIILIIMGMVDFARAVMASDEKKMKDSQKRFINRLIAGIVVFLVMAVVQFVFKQIDGMSEYKNGFINCINCMLNDNQTACSGGSNDLRRSCSDYDVERGKCTGVDDYGHTCAVDTSVSPKKCVVKGESCSTFNRNECSSSKNSAGVSCQLVNGSCIEVCKGLSYQSCLSRSDCRPDGTPPNNVVCVSR